MLWRSRASASVVVAATLTLALLQMTRVSCGSMVPKRKGMVKKGRNATRNSCDLFSGRWVRDDDHHSVNPAAPTPPPYNQTSCPFIRKEFSCQKNGRKDEEYLHYRWQPFGCDLARFDGRDFLEKFRGKKIMFVGDSLSLNQWQSLICLLHSSVPNARYNTTLQGSVSSFSIPDYDVNVMLARSVYLVDVVKEDVGRVLKLGSMEGGKLWLGMDMLIFNTWHWWTRRGPTQPWDYIEDGSTLMKDMDRISAFEKAVGTWANWVDQNIDPSKTKVFFQGISPSHYNSSDWGGPKNQSCKGETEPLLGTTYPAGVPKEVLALKRALAKIKRCPVTLLDANLLSQLRKDAHPSIYGLFTLDCSHWCLPGLPDTWNQILYNFLLLN